jgi:hypothetical protein
MTIDGAGEVMNGSAQVKEKPLLKAGPIVIDVPMPRPEVPEAERCRHRRPDGGRCTDSKAAGKEMCEMHNDWHASVPAALGLPFPEDAVSLQRFLAKMLDLVMTGTVKPHIAKQTETLVKMLFRNAGACEWELQHGRRR